MNFPLFREIVQAASSRKMRFLTIGGHAVAHHHFSRATEDVDLLISKADRVRWLEVAAGLGFKLFHDGGNFLQLVPETGTTWRLDLMLVSPETFEKMFADAEFGTVEGVAVQLAGLNDLLALKLHALQHAQGIRVLKDMNDLVMLITNNRVDVKSDGFRSMALKYGNAELYAKLIRACAP